MDRYRMDLNIVEWHVVMIDWLSLHQIQTLKAVNNLSEDRIAFVELGLL